ncbi:MAG: preprotein translocase subunit SecA [Sphaerochaetaceae bacterium]
MAKRFLPKLFKTKNERDIKRLSPYVEKVNSFSCWAQSLKEEDFPLITASFKKRLSETESLDSILPEAFALVREAAFRVLGERHYDEQIMGSVVLHQGTILEMKTGEGKTLSCVPAAYLNALEGKGVHIVTVNDYLAQRDANWMGPIYRYLGLSVGFIVSDMETNARRDAYNCDVTYGTNNEFGFDYLRDNMKWDWLDKIQVDRNFCIIDEIDSILIDEARTPLIISGQAEDDTQKIRSADSIVKFLKEVQKEEQTDEYVEEGEGDYQIDEKQKKVTFSNQGLITIESLLQKNRIITGSLYDGENFEYVHYMTQAVKAHKLFFRDVDYVVAENKVEIVDEFTGRILHGRRYSDGLHQAIEAKENIKVELQNKTLATITFQNFFRMYKKISGMTGTADTEAGEFQKIYNLDVVVVPTHLPVVRNDHQDLIYLNEQFKNKAICDEIERVHKKGQPILLGTVSIEKSEQLSSLLRQRAIKHEVLNAKNHHREALIIENAGSKGAVTIATNMAGRGTDIKLGGSLDAMARTVCGSDATTQELEQAKKKVYEKWQKSYQEVKSLGGLYILGTERHESRRIDNQLRGRSGRQGDPGESRFFLSLDDTLMRLFAKDSLKSMLDRIGMGSDPIEHSLVSKAIEKAQMRVEQQNFEIRKHLLEYDDVLNEQRNYLYLQRDSILKADNLIERALEAISDIVESIVQKLDYESNKSKVIVNQIAELTTEEFHYPVTFSPRDVENKTKEELEDLIYNYLKSDIKKKTDQIGNQVFNEFLRFQYIRQIDIRWQEHLEQLEALREAVYLRTYAQKNPLLEYKLEGFEIFDSMIDQIRSYVATLLVRVQIDSKESAGARQKTRNIVESHFDSNQFSRGATHAAQTLPGQSSMQIVRNQPKVGRNELCPCGSGKKYKHCHGQ